MNLNSTVAVAVRRALMVGAISTSVVAPVFAQESASAGAELETIVVLRGQSGLDLVHPLVVAFGTSFDRGQKCCKLVQRVAIPV